MIGSVSITGLAEVFPEERNAVPQASLQGCLIVVNRTSKSLWNFNARGHESGSWGEDVLEGAIFPGEERSWWVVAGTYHLRAEAGNGDRAMCFGVAVPEGDAVTWTICDE